MKYSPPDGTGVHAARVASALVTGLLLVSAVGGGVAAGATTDGTVRKSVTAALDGDRVAVTVAYRLPDGVADLAVTLPIAASDASRVTELRGFRRTNATTFEWTGAADPAVELSLGDGSDRVLAGDGWALVVEPDAATSYGYRGREPGFESSFAAAGEGYAAGSFAYLGPYRTTSALAGGERTTFVVAAGADSVDVSGAVRFLELAPGRFDLGVRHDATTAFVVPGRHEPDASARIAGATVETSLRVDPSAVRPNTTEATFAHEYVHTRLGVVGEGSTRWLTEASAEYFGHAFALNAGVGDYGSFRDGLDPGRYDDGARSVTLSEPDTWAGTAADYAKGALVLAALDAEIRRRTDGAHTLADVFVERPGPYADHATFRRAVVETTGEASLGDWIDRYATTDATPSLPSDPALYVYGPDLDPDGDGATSGTERDRGTNPFVAGRETPTGTPTPEPEPTPTPTGTTAPETTTAENGETTGDGGGFGAGVAALGVAALAAALAGRR